MSMYDTNVLIGVVENKKTPSSFFRDRFYPTSVESDTEAVSIDVMVGKRRVSPFVSPLVQGKVVNGQGMRTDTYKPPYVKDKRVLDPTKPLRRAVGERIGGALTGAQREQAYLDGELQDQLEMLARREEVMAAESFVRGKVLVQGEGFPSVDIDFQRDNSLTTALTGADRWGQANIYPSEDIEEWATLMLKASGLVPTDIIFTPTPWKLFKKDANVKDDIDNTKRGGTSAIDTSPTVKAGAMFKGTWGQFNLWLHNDWYIDPADGVEKPFVPDNRVILAGDVQGVRNYGMILDPEAQYRPAKYFPKSWIEKDPAVRMLMLQAAPLPVPKNINATFCANIDGGS